MLVAEKIISSRTNARVKQLRAAFQGQARLSDGFVAIEGDHLITEALRSGLVLHSVFVTESRPLPHGIPQTTEILRLSSDVFASAVETQSPQGIAALIYPPEHQLSDALTSTSLLLIAVGLQDPGNLGTLIRSAEAFGATGVLTTPGTVNPWNQKALRASVGSLFRIPVITSTSEEISALKKHGLRLLAAVGHEDATAADTLNLTEPCAIMIGNEGAGLTPEWLKLADARITIPCPGPVESLNAGVAGSLLLYEASRQRRLL